MMCDTNWCTFCDNAISPYSDSLYCSEDCLRQDALMHHPMLGYDYAELEGFPHSTQMPSLVRRKSSIPTLAASSNSNSSNSTDFIQLQKIPSLSPSLSSSISSYSSAHPCDTNADFNKSNNDTYAAASYFHPKPRKVSSIPFMEQLNQALLQC
ncbi:hypothetical protein MAM1_0023d01954 [Mucor ambiguus]|uniref:Uncharacterized protein n=1 Tax=Mucor ambiguus TaxID=91626 RepID=A0A0C9LS30_9FUNG|nr:hypothetical protein MAM1_0023d01954 [Mucor ambiguus]